MHSKIRSLPSLKHTQSFYSPLLQSTYQPDSNISVLNLIKEATEFSYIKHQKASLLEVSLTDSLLSHKWLLFFCMHHLDSHQIFSRELKVKHQRGFLGFKTRCSKEIISSFFCFKGGEEEGRKVLDLCQNNHLTSKTCLSVSLLWNFPCTYWRVQFFHKTQYYVRGTDKYFQLDPEIANVLVED